MSGEKSVLSGEAGQLITKKLLELCGWQISEHIDFECLNGEKHKSKSSVGNRKQHSIDGIECYKSPLNHSIQKLVLISAKHHIDEYPNSSLSKLNSTTKELAQAIECAKESSTISEKYIFEDNEGRNIEFDGLITFFSSSPTEKHKSFSNNIGYELSIPKDNFNAIFFIDNKKATFLFSAIMEAKSQSDYRNISFIYPDTGTNQEPEKLSLAGNILPLELMCSDVLPIIIKKGENYHVLIFCNDLFEDKYLKRIIWLVHRLCGFATSTTIYFPDFDRTKHENTVKTIKQAFSESNYIAKIDVKKWDDLSFIKLKEDTSDYRDTANLLQNFPKSTSLLSLGKISEDFDKILPFGNMIKPLLNSSLLTASDLKEFLKGKGILVKYAEKELIIPILANLLLSPNELNHLKGLLVEIEDKPKSLNKSARFYATLTDLKDVINNFDPNNIKLRQNCRHLKQPRFVQKAENRFEMEIEIERTNTTKDLISGKTIHQARFTVLLEHNNLNNKIEFTSHETKLFLTDISSALNFKFRNSNFIHEDLKSITFRDFLNNKERVEFLTGFKNIDFSGNFSNGEIINIQFKPDESILSLPNELQSYRGKVKNLDINGNLLEELPHIYNEEYQSSILLARVKIKFDFEVDGNSGVCIAEIGFPSTLNGKEVDMETELIVTLEIIRTKGDNITGNIQRLQNKLSRIIDQIVLSKYSGATVSIAS